MNLKKELKHFRDELKKMANPVRAKGAKRYLKSPYIFFGVYSSGKNQILKDWLQDHKNLSFDDIISMADGLWNSKYHEKKTLAVTLLHRYSKQLTSEHLPFLEKMVKEVNNWDHLDEISIRLLGRLIDNEPQTLKRLPVWVKSDNFWVRRSALLSQILQFRRKEGDKQLFFKLAIPMFKEEENWSKEERFFIRKAIGWVLREIAQKEPKIVFDFVKQYGDQMSGLTFREATRKLPEEMQKNLNVNFKGR